MNDYSVTVETSAPGGDEQLVDRRAIDELMGLLEEHGGVVSAGPEWSSWDASIGVEAATAAEATRVGQAVIADSAAKAGLPDWPVVRVETIDEDARDDLATSPNMPDLVSGPEIARLLGVSRQRVHQLAAGNPQFPKPLYRLGVGSLWTRSAIERFAEEWERKPGRPKASA